MLVLKALLVAEYALVVQLPVAQVEGVALPETLQVIGHQDQASLNHQEVRLRVLREKKEIIL